MFVQVKYAKKCVARIEFISIVISQVCQILIKSNFNKF